MTSQPSAARPKHRLRGDGEDVALLACRLLVSAFDQAKQTGRSLNRDDIEAAYVAARAALDQTTTAGSPNYSVKGSAAKCLKLLARFFTREQ